MLWITVVSPQGPDDLELVLEPNANPAGKAFQEAMFARGIPLAAFEAADIAEDYARLKAQGVASPRSRDGTPSRPRRRRRPPQLFAAGLAAARSEWFSRW